MAKEKTAYAPPELWTQLPLPFGGHFREKAYLDKTSPAEQATDREAFQRWASYGKEQLTLLENLSDEELDQYLTAFYQQLPTPESSQQLERVLTFPKELKAARLANLLQAATFGQDPSFQAALARYQAYIQPARK
jgi:hypothetical protein